MKPKAKREETVMLIEKSGVVRELPARLVEKIMTNKQLFLKEYKEGLRKKPPRTYSNDLRIMTPEELSAWEDAGRPGVLNYNVASLSNSLAGKDAEIEKLLKKIEAMEAEKSAEENATEEKKPGRKKATDNPLKGGDE